MNLRLRELIDDEAFNTKRVELLKERERLNERRTDTEGQADRWCEMVERVLIFAHAARQKFHSGAAQQKRMILEIIGAELILTNKKLTFEPIAPFSSPRDTAQKSIWRGTVEDVRQFCMERRIFMCLTWGHGAWNPEKVPEQLPAGNLHGATRAEPANNLQGALYRERRKTPHLCVGLVGL